MSFLQGEWDQAVGALLTLLHLIPPKEKQRGTSAILTKTRQDSFRIVGQVSHAKILFIFIRFKFICFLKEGTPLQSILDTWKSAYSFMSWK